MSTWFMYSHLWKCHFIEQSRLFILKIHISNCPETKLHKIWLEIHLSFLLNPYREFMSKRTNTNILFNNRFVKLFKCKWMIEKVLLRLKYWTLSVTIHHSLASLNDVFLRCRKKHCQNCFLHWSFIELQPL